MTELSLVPWSVPDGRSSDGRSLGRVERLELVQADPNAMAVVCQRVIDGESLREIARAWELPTLRFAAWVGGDPERLAAYEGALRVRADELAHQVLGVADDTAGEVPRDALRVKTRLQLAGFWDRERYGTGAGVSGKRTRVVVDRTCGAGPDGPQTDRVAVEIEE